MSALETKSDVELRQFGERSDLYTAFVEGMSAAEEDWHAETDGGDDCLRLSPPLPDDFLTEQQSDELSGIDSYLTTDGDKE